ncbi:MAG: type VI secretion system baseplate subunit TssF [Herbaspirillum sp.]
MFNRYYEDELNKLKSLAVEFARNNPGLAPMLSGPSTDPDVERLLEGVAFLAGLTRQKIDDEFPEFVQELANLLFPHFLRPIPATTLVDFAPKGALAETVHVAAGTELASVPVDGTRCQFRTCHELEIQPLILAEVNLLTPAGAAPMLIMDFDLQGLDLSQWDSDHIRLFLGNGYTEAAKLLLLLTNHVTAVRVASRGSERFDLGVKGLRPSGFDMELLPYPSHAFPGFRCVQEFFVQPEKFLFIDIEGFKRWTTRGNGSHFMVFISLSHIPEWVPEIRNDSFLLNVVPVINLFQHAADPITHEHRVTEYRILPEAQNRQHYQVYSVDRVTGFQQGVAEQRNYLPFGLLQHDGRGAKPSYRTTQRAATIGRGSEIFLSVVYPPGEIPQTETLSVQITCTNRLLPESLKLGDINQATATSPDRMTFRNIRAITSALNPPSGEGLLWRLISHASLNFMSIANATNLQALLSLYVFSDRQDQGRETTNRRRIEGIQEVTAVAETRLIGRGSILRGQRIQIKCRPDYFAGIGDMYLFGCVLNQFFGDYASINSYTRVELKDAFSGATFKWSPRLGQQPLL